MADATLPAQTVQQLGEGWVAVTQAGSSTFYVHEQTNTTTWERPRLAGEACHNFGQALMARYSLTDAAGVTAAAQVLIQSGVGSIEHFEEKVHVDQLSQLPFKRGDALKIKAKRAEAMFKQERDMAAAAAAAAPHRTKSIGSQTSHSSVVLSVRGFDIAAVWTQAVVNAANEASFTDGDAGVSGVLRNACSDVGRAGYYSDVCRQPKTWLVHGAHTVVEQTGYEVPETQVGLQPAGGRLRRCGVRWVLHAVGPRWTQYTEVECQTRQSPQFRHIETMIQDTVWRALSLAVHLGCQSVTIPAISGGIFCHSNTGTGLQEVEQLASREALVAACITWMRREHGAPGTLAEIVLVDHPNPRVGRLDLLVHAFDQCFGAGSQEATSLHARADADVRTDGAGTRFLESQQQKLSTAPPNVSSLSTSTSGALPEGLPKQSGGGGAVGHGRFVFNKTLSTEIGQASARPGGMEAADTGAGSASPLSGSGPATLTDRLISYGIPPSKVEGYVEKLLQCVADRRPPAAYERAVKPTDVMELFDACDLDDLKREIGVTKGHIRVIAKHSPSRLHKG